MRLYGNPTAWCLFWLQCMPVIPGMYGMHYRLKIRRLKCDSTANGCIEKTRVLIKGKETLRSYAVNHGNKLCHPPHDDERQQLQQQQYIKPQPGTQQQAGIYEYILVRRAAAKSIWIRIDQVQVLCCVSGHGVYVTIRKNSINNSNTEQQQHEQHYVCILNWLLDCSDDASIIIDDRTYLTLEHKHTRYCTWLKPQTPRS